MIENKRLISPEIVLCNSIKNILKYSSLTILSILALPDSVRSEEKKEDKVPDFVSSERKLSDEALKKKRSGIFVTGIHSFSSDPLNGFGAGATGYIFFNGSPEDTLFAYTPYFVRAGLNLKYSTGNR